MGQQVRDQGGNEGEEVMATWDEIRREAQHVIELANDHDYSGGQELAEMVLACGIAIELAECQAARKLLLANWQQEARQRNAAEAQIMRMGGEFRLRGWAEPE